MIKRLIIKIGSDILTTKNGLNHERIKSFAKEISSLHDLGYEVLLVSSGAISSGAKMLGLTKRPEEIVEKRVLAAIGQCYLMEAWIKAFNPILVAQALLTWKELADEESKLKARETILKILEKKIIPIVNENDAIADEEIRFSDNDQLALKVAKLIHAERLILLTDVDGLYTNDPKDNKNAKLISHIVEVDDSVKSMVGESKSEHGLGGMLSKLAVAEEALEFDIKTNILNGNKDGFVLSLLKDKINLGTEFSKH